MKVVDGAYTWYRWAGWSIVGEYGDDGLGTGWGIDDRELGYIPGLAQFTHDSVAGTYDYNFFLQDHLGSTRNVLDESKSLLASLSYTPYGEELQFGGKLPSPRYTGHHWDSETGMYFAPFRYYMPGSGRWLSRDPLDFWAGQNLYGYVGGSPVARMDPLGLDWWPPTKWFDCWGAGCVEDPDKDCNPVPNNENLVKDQINNAVSTAVGGAHRGFQVYHHGPNKLSGPTVYTAVLHTEVTLVKAAPAAAAAVGYGTLTRKRLDRFEEGGEILYGPPGHTKKLKHYCSK